MNNKALLVGINKYPDPRNELRGCINDILDMEHFISSTHKVYAPENIKKLTDKDASKKVIIAQIQWLLESAQPGDQLLFHYSGHGSQIPTHHASLEKDGLDEIICPYDFDGSHNTALRDKEFAQLFAGIPQGVHFVWISDSCHAEDLSRDPVESQAHRYRFFNKSLVVEAESVGLGDGLLGDGMQGPSSVGSKLDRNELSKPLNGALLSACASQELSADAYINNRFNGAFTYYLIQNLLRYSDSISMKSIVESVNGDLIKNGYDQNPQSEGLLESKTFFL
jgi:hypothetical protein